MIHQHLALLIAGSLAAGSLASAQEKGAGTAGVKAPATVQEAGARPAELSLPVIGLTKDNMAKAEKAVAALQMTQFCCEDCTVALDKAGKCTTCGEALSEKQVPVVKGVKLSVDGKLLSFRLNDATRLGLAQLDAALRPEAIHVDRDALTIRGPAHVVFADVASKDGAMAIEKALKDAKVLPNAKVTFREEAKEAQVPIEGVGTPVKFSAFTALSKPAGVAWSVSDIIWTTPPKPKG